MTPGIPVIDIAPALSGGLEDRLRVARAIDRTCTEIGFFTIAGHGVPTAVMDDLRSAAYDFFHLPLEEKRRAVHPVAGTPRGYRALGIEALAAGNGADTPPDLKEYYHFGRERWPDEPYYGSAEGQRYFIPNLWPERPAGFAAAAERYYVEMERLTGFMMRLTALALGIDERFFDDKIDRHITAMRINFYPAQAVPPAPGQLRAGAHTDYGLLTILNGENVPGGLQVLTRGGAWVDVETDPGTFVINIGDLLMRWTNDRWVSNTHRVVNPPAEAAAAERMSIAFFHHPNYDALVECVAPPGGAKHPPVRSGDYRDLKYRQTRVSAA
ncbi:isopenicillin N synthase family dioxygenase [Azospirillum sp. ST 5-10]|uniref:isopenicillin N synthase family dioxygenase n=1 Tax=unclassified Azospirillum TaxID=2630922 RepID=UPI003F4A5162